MDLIKVAEEAFATAKQFPEFGPGDTITVAYRIKEGNKERIQQYRGVVIRISGEGNKKRFTVRKISDNIGVERIFPIESPFIDSIVVNKYGKVRRANFIICANLPAKSSYQRAPRKHCQIIAGYPTNEKHTERAILFSPLFFLHTPAHRLTGELKKPPDFTD